MQIDSNLVLDKLNQKLGDAIYANTLLEVQLELLIKEAEAKDAKIASLEAEKETKPSENHKASNGSENQ